MADQEFECYEKGNIDMGDMLLFGCFYIGLSGP